MALLSPLGGKKLRTLSSLPETVSQAQSQGGYSLSDPSENQQDVTCNRCKRENRAQDGGQITEDSDSASRAPLLLCGYVTVWEVVNS